MFQIIINYNRHFEPMQEDLIDKMRQDDAYFRSIIENNSFYIIKTDLQGRYTYLNPFFCKMLDLKAQDWLGKDSLSLIMPVDHDVCIAAVEKCFADPQNSYWAILRKPVPKGVLSTQWEFKMLLDTKGDPCEVLCIGHDITPLILKQEQLQSLVDITAEQNKRLLNFTYIISHNIRSHVANIIGIVDISDDLDDDKLAIGMIKDSSESLDKTLHDLNEIISIQSSTSLPVKEINIFEEIQRIIQSIQVLVSSAGTIITYHFGTNENLSTNPAYFESIILNVVTNALKYRNPDRPLKITMNITEEDGYKIVNFKDNGVGINMEKYGHELFGMYKTFHKNKDARGLGLYIIKAQIEAMQGKIEVESEVDTGTTFKLYFKKL